MELAWVAEDLPEVVDPYVDFRLNVLRRFEPGFADDEWWLAVIELTNKSLQQLIDDIKERDDLRDSLLIPAFYGEEFRNASDNPRHFAVHVRRNFLEHANSDRALGVTRIALGTTVPKDWLATADDAEPATSAIRVPDEAVIVAVIDNGIAFAHDLFRRGPASSRVEFAWIMDTTGSNVSAAPQGRQLTRAEIDALLAKHHHAGLLDEDAVYAEAGLVDHRFAGIKPAAMRLSHGTHVMSIAAGNEPGLDAALRPIICVQLPTSVTMDVSGYSLGPYLSMALDYVLVRAGRFVTESGARPPMVVNFSYGNNAGPHDGTGVIEAMIDQRLPAASGNRVVMPAGNANLGRTHAEIRFPDGDDADRVLMWRVLPDDRTASRVELWMPPNEDEVALVEVRVTPPCGASSGPVTTTPGSAQCLMVAVDGVPVTVGRMGYFKPKGSMRGLIAIDIVPTASDRAPAALAPAGLWTIAVTRRELPRDRAVQVWIERDASLPGFPVFGRQSHFEDRYYVQNKPNGNVRAEDPPPAQRIGGIASAIRREGTLSGYACGNSPIVAAGYVASSGAMAGYSAHGPAFPRNTGKNPNRTGPDAAAISDDTPVLDGIFGAGSRSGSIVAMRGTSVAAPRIARWVAMELQNGGNGDRRAVSAEAVRQESTGGHPPPLPPEKRAGGGRLKTAFRIGSDRRA